MLEAKFHKTAAAWPFNSHQNKTNKAWWALVGKLRRTHNRRSFMDSFTGTCQCWPISRKMPTSFCVSTGYSLEDQPRAITDRDEWQESVKKLKIINTFWWYIYIYIYIYVCVCVCVCVYIYIYIYIRIECNFLSLGWYDNNSLSLNVCPNDLSVRNMHYSFSPDSIILVFYNRSIHLSIYWPIDQSDTLDTLQYIIYC